jgi:hypothetical protein
MQYIPCYNEAYKIIHAIMRHTRQLRGMHDSFTIQGQKEMNTTIYLLSLPRTSNLKPESRTRKSGNVTEARGNNSQ